MSMTDDISGGNSNPGTNVQQWTDNGLDPQKWRLEQR